MDLMNAFLELRNSVKQEMSPDRGSVNDLGGNLKDSLDQLLREKHSLQ